MRRQGYLGAEVLGPSGGIVVARYSELLAHNEREDEPDLPPPWAERLRRRRASSSSGPPALIATFPADGRR